MKMTIVTHPTLAYYEKENPDCYNTDELKSMKERLKEICPDDQEYYILYNMIHDYDKEKNSISIKVKTSITRYIDDNVINDIKMFFENKFNVDIYKKCYDNSKYNISNAVFLFYDKNTNLLYRITTISGVYRGIIDCFKITEEERNKDDWFLNYSLQQDLMTDWRKEIV